MGRHLRPDGCPVHPTPLRRLADHHVRPLVSSPRARRSGCSRTSCSCCSAAIRQSEMVGLSPATTVVIETDGAIEQADDLKVAYHGAAATGLHVATRPTRRGPRAAWRRGPAAGSTRAVAAVPVLPHPSGLRRRPLRAPVPGGHRVRNPSVYCPDLIRLIGHIRAAMQADIDRSCGRQDGRLNVRYHRDIPRVLRCAGGGGGGPEAIRELAAAEHSKHCCCCAGCIEAAEADGHRSGPVRPQWPGMTADAMSSTAIRCRRADDRLSLCRGLGGCALCARLRGAGRGPGPSPATLAAVAAAAAVRSGLDAEVPVRPAAGQVCLPSLGAAAVEADIATVRSSGGQRRDPLGARPDGHPV